MRLTKHHGLGTTSWCCSTSTGAHPVSAELARAMCARHVGIGADGIMRATAGDAVLGTDVTMELRNADGGEAEISGNGIRCLGQALVMAGIAAGPEIVVGTAAGVRRLVVRPTERPGLHWVSVDMGQARLVDGDAEACNVDTGRRLVDMGNPHLVLLGPDPAHLAVGSSGRRSKPATRTG